MPVEMLSLAKQGLAGILFSKNFGFQIHKVFSDPNGYFIISDTIAGSKPLTVANIYALNEDELIFFEFFFSDHLSSFKCDEFLIVGDFNLVLVEHTIKMP